MARPAPPDPARPDAAQPVPEHPEEPRPGERRTYSAEEVSQGYIVLRTRTRKIIFFGGLIGAVLLAIIVGFLR